MEGEENIELPEWFPPEAESPIGSGKWTEYISKRQEKKIMNP